MSQEVEVAAGSPTVRRRRLAAELRRLRGNQTGGMVAKALGWSPAKISRYELGQGGFPPNEIKKLLDYYDVTEPRRTQLLGLAADANARGWWEDFAPEAISPDFTESIGLEAEADSVAQWEIESVPGLFQTPEYAWHIMDAIQGVMPTPPTVIEQRVRVRMIRQRVLTEREPPLKLSVVLDESALLRQVGGPGVMREQLTRMAELAELPNVDLRVLPLRKACSLVDCSFVVFGFGSLPEGGRILGDVVSTESVASGELHVEGEMDTYTYRLLFKALANASLPVAETRHLILRAADSWRD
ncbi:MAG: helix-turn-helix domain-containing protein [Nocardiopsaceae bacterium]|nr:helix-turn-helix domain-containing protein [Nocardiopsaceae bacterium]